MIMPASNYSALRDQHLRNIIDFIRQAPVFENGPGTSTASIMAREHFAYLRDDEIKDLLRFLQAQSYD